ncbi:hypothetical protein OB920_18525 [Halobacteria archaeon HArc-gm2]|nr:hypothetical protein [Halobacteria archaeon HArc-gm2]
MAEFQIAERYSLPRDVAGQPDDEVEPRLDDALSECLPDDRLVARNRALDVVVSLPRHFYPSIDKGGAQYTNISISPIDQTVADMAAALDAVESMLDPPAGLKACHYGVRAGSIQLSSNTPGRFLTDFEDVASIAPTVDKRRPVLTRNAIKPEVIGACVWPTSYGTFYLQAQRRHGNTTANVHYGILAHGMPLDTTPIEEFFDALADGAVPSQAPWPYRQLTLAGLRSLPITNAESIDDDIVAAESDVIMKLTHAGENPVYQYQPPENAFSWRAREEIYDQLRAISTLGYETKQIDQSGPYVLDTIHALDMPVNHLCLVTTTLDSKPGA